MNCFSFSRPHKCESTHTSQRISFVLHKPPTMVASAISLFDKALSFDYLLEDDDVIPSVEERPCEAMIWDSFDSTSSSSVDDYWPLFQEDDFILEEESDELLVANRTIDESSLPFEKRFEATRRSLELCMRRSQETRPSLTLSTTTEEISKHVEESSVKGVVDSVEQSARKLQSYFWAPSTEIVEHAQQ